MGPLHQIPLIHRSLVVGILLLGFVLRRRRNAPRSSGVRKNVPESLVSPESVVQLNESLYELHRPVGIPNLQVVFFHGISAGEISRAFLSTWECGDGSSIWPQTWLVDEFPRAHVFSVQYDAGFGVADHRSDMFIIAETLLQDLIQGNIGQVPHCPVVLVGHSVGGLVIKNLCLLARDSIHRNGFRNFLERIEGILFYATPHRGIGHIPNVTDFLDSPLMKHFQTLSTEAALVYEKFRILSLSHKWLITGLGETLPVSVGRFRGVVVEEGSARAGVDYFHSVPEDHFSISKPRTKTSRSFTVLREFLHSIVMVAKLFQGKNRADFQYVPKQIQGIYSQLQEVKHRLSNGKPLCFTGVGGSGKTTLAKIVFNELASQFEYTCFVPDFKFIGGSEEALKAEVWKRMCHDGEKVGGESDWSKLCGKKLLLALDDISSKRDTNVLKGISDGPSLESRFIVTSREPNLLDDIYSVALLDKDNAQQLFVSHAFPYEVTLPADLASLIGDIVKNCEGLPLTLEVIGKCLRDTKAEHAWRNFLSTLEKLGDIIDPNERLWEKLKLSYNILDSTEQLIFLDATTFFASDKKSRYNWTLREAKVAWKKTYFQTVDSTWHNLVRRGLVDNVDEDEFITVHEHLRDLGQKIASESKETCRVWTNEEALKLLQSTNASDKQDIYALRMVKEIGCSNEKQIQVAGPTLQKLKNLRYLQVEAPVIIDTPLEDKWFPRNLVLLQCMDLQVIELALQSRLVVLKLFDVDATYLPRSLGNLSALRIFRLWNARNLQSLPDEIGNLFKLKYLELVHCPCLHSLPESFGSLRALVELKFERCQELKVLPDSFGDLPKLSRLEFHACNLQSLPASFGNLRRLSLLKFEDCPKLESLPDSFGYLQELWLLEVSGCAFQRLPKSFGDLIARRRGRLELLTLVREEIPD